MDKATTPPARFAASGTGLTGTPEIVGEGCWIIGFDWTCHAVVGRVSQVECMAGDGLPGCAVLATCPGLEQTELFSSFHRAMTERVSLKLQHRSDDTGGMPAWFDIRIQPVQEGILVISMDVTAQKREEEELRVRNAQLEARLAAETVALAAANKELEAFSASVSHDLRAPLRHMDGFARLAIEQSSDMDGSTKEYLTKIVKASGRMGTLIDNLLVLSRAGRAELHIRPVDLQSLVKGVGDECLRQAGQRDVQWLVGDLPKVQADHAQLRQVFINLIGNAFKFTRKCERAVIEVSAQAAGNDHVEICVRDNGAGFDMQFVDKLYGVFQRLHHERDFEGNGIGLATVRKTIERLGGKTWAEGEPGQGAAFYVRLKRA